MPRGVRSERKALERRQSLGPPSPLPPRPGFGHGPPALGVVLVGGGGPLARTLHRTYGGSRKRAVPTAGPTAEEGGDSCVTTSRGLAAAAQPLAVLERRADVALVEVQRGRAAPGYITSPTSGIISEVFE